METQKTGKAKPINEKEIPKELDGLEHSLSVLEKKVEILGEEISPALLCADPEVCTAVERVDPYTDIAQNIRKKTQIVDRIIRQLDDWTERLQI